MGTNAQLVVDFAQVERLVAGARQNDRFVRVEHHFVDRAEMTGQFVQNTTILRVPDVDESISRPSGHLGACVGVTTLSRLTNRHKLCCHTIWRPTAPQEVLFEVVLVAVQCVHAAVLRSKWPHVPNATCVVHRV